MSEKIRYAMDRFPDLAQAIKQYCADNRFFHGLCEDYGEAVEVLRQWEQSGEQSSGSAESERISTCRELVTDLEREILLELERWNGG
ncbi:hypothetical protein [Azospirillum sp. sgz302134]